MPIGDQVTVLRPRWIHKGWLLIPLNLSLLFQTFRRAAKMASQTPLRQAPPKQITNAATPLTKEILLDNLYSKNPGWKDPCELMDTEAVLTQKFWNPYEPGDPDRLELPTIEEISSWCGRAQGGEAGPKATDPRACSNE